MPDRTTSRQLLADVRDLIEIVDRRLVQLRRNGTPEAIRQMEDIRERMVELQLSVAPQPGADPSVA
jgi:hypothetical protein